MPEFDASYFLSPEFLEHSSMLKPWPIHWFSPKTSAASML